MKTIIKILPLLFVFACGTPEKKSGVAELISERDSLKIEYKKLGKTLRKLDDEIAKLDTSRKLTLITAFEIKAGEFEHFFDARGNVEADKNTSIFPEVPGTIEAVKVVDGQNVKKGDVLIVLNTDLMNKQINEIKTQLELANKLYDKQKNLYDQKIGSEVQYLEAKNRKESLENTLSTLRSQKSKSIIKAPYSGVVEDIMGKVGGLANPAMPIAHMINLDKIYITSEISERMVSKISKGTYVLVTFPSLDLEIPSKIRYTGNFINENNRTFKIQLDLPNTSSKNIKPNMVPILKIKDYHSDNSLVVKSSTIQQDSEGKDFVYTAENVENGTYKVNKNYVKTNLSYKGFTEITEGIKEGDLLVNKGARYVKDGQFVHIVAGE